MKKIIITTLFFFSVIYFGSAQQKILFINPVFTEQDAKLKPEAEGVWYTGFSGNFSIQKVGDNFYHLRYGDEHHPSLYEVVFFQVQSQLLLDMYGIRDSVWDKDYEENFLPAHSIAKVNIIQDTFYFSELNYSWFYDLIKQDKTGLNYLFNDHGVVITSPTPAVNYFLSKHLNDIGAFNEHDAFILTNKPKIPNKISFKEIQNETSDEIARQDYILSFPMKDGWLGADNDASIPISNNRTLWLFGDTYIGNKQQKNRDSISGMVSSSAAISGKSPDGKFTIEYFWKDMYAQHPKPIFQSYTDRYRYWIKDAFVFQKNLYVLLRKIAAWPGARIDEPFSFILGGSAFAKVSDFENTTPDQWKEELIPFPYLFDSTFDCEQFVKDGSYIYFFLNRKNKPHNITQLVRLPCIHLDSAAHHFEYFSKAHSWKQGMHADDMLTVLNDAPGNTIRYHPDLKLWVMVCGPGLMDRRIVIHTAPSLTGPWSEGKVVYECPEQTPGSGIYDQNNFCYLGREHIQFYDKEKQVMLITYDWNTTDMRQVKQNPKIYIPRILRIPLSK
jgi:hypothetical protein